MRTVFIISFLMATQLLFSQDMSWFHKIDTLSYEIFYDKKTIPQTFYSVIGIETRNDIVNPNGNFSKGCTGPGKRIRFNWLAKDKNNHWVISISYGGIAYNTKYFFFDSEGEKMNCKGIYFTGYDAEELTFTRAISKIYSKEYYYFDIRR